MRRFPSTMLAASLVVGLAACAPSSASQGQAGPSEAGASVGGSQPPTSVAPSGAASPAFTTGPGGTPIGTWSLTLTGPPSAGTYGGSDEMICVGLEGGPWSVAFRPVGSEPVGQVDAGVDPEGSGTLLVSAGGLENDGTYLSSSTQVLEGPAVENGVLHLKMHGADSFGRTIDLTADCPLFPAETDG